MSKFRRILFELLAPPFLAAILIITTDTSDTFLGMLAGFLPFLFFAYAFGIIPSLIYMLAMEFWFQSGLRARCGFLCTIGLSCLLGVGAGFLSAWLGIWLGFLTQPDNLHLARIGGIVGSLIGFYVGRRQTTVA
jgi:hypothetical protein